MCFWALQVIWYLTQFCHSALPILSGLLYNHHNPNRLTVARGKSGDVWISYRQCIVYLCIVMMTSSNGNISMLLALCAGNSPATGEFFSQRPVTRSFDVFFDLRPNKQLSKQPRGWWFETLSRPLWRHRNVYILRICRTTSGLAIDNAYYVCV